MRHLKDEIANLQQFQTRCFEQECQLKNYRENIIPSKDSTIGELRNEVRHLKDEITYLQQFKTLCFEQESQLKNYRENIIPCKENTIGELRNEVAELSGLY